MTGIDRAGGIKELRSALYQGALSYICRLPDEPKTAKQAWLIKLVERAGRLEPPAIGSIVELGFIFGQPDKPFIRCILPLGFRLPGIKQGESRYQQRKGVFHHVDQDGNFESTTDKNAALNCIDRTVNATNYTAVIEPMRKIVVKQNEEITILKDRIEKVEGQASLTVSKDLIITAKNITQDADTIKLNGGKGVCTGATTCAFTGKPHVDVSITVFAGKK